MNIVYTKGHNIEKINKWEEQINISLEKSSKFFGLSSTMVSNLGELEDLLYGTIIIGAISTLFSFYSPYLFK